MRLKNKTSIVFWRGGGHSIYSDYCRRNGEKGGTISRRKSVGVWDDHKKWCELVASTRHPNNRTKLVKYYRSSMRNRRPIWTIRQCRVHNYILSFHLMCIAYSPPNPKTLFFSISVSFIYLFLNQGTQLLRTLGIYTVQDVKDGTS